MVPRAKLVCGFKAKMLGPLSAFLKEIMAEKSKATFLFVVNCSFKYYSSHMLIEQA